MIVIFFLMVSMDSLPSLFTSNVIFFPVTDMTKIGIKVVVGNLTKLTSHSSCMHLTMLVIRWA
jgi:hypothetical protein